MVKDYTKLERGKAGKMKLVSYIPNTGQEDLRIEMFKPRQELGRGGVLVGDQIYDLFQFCNWAGQTGNLRLSASPVNLLGFVSLELEQRQALAVLAAGLPSSDLESWPLDRVRLRAPLEMPNSVRDFYAFEQHVKTARANRGLGVIPEWYNFPVFYFSNHRAIYGPGDYIPHPRQSEALDLELEIACVLGKTGRDIPASEGADYIAGYTIMNDWSSRDLQMEEMKMNLGPAKGKDFATSLGPYLVTPDELEGRRLSEGAGERFDLEMTARLNGKEISRGNLKDIYFSFPQMVERASLNAWVMPGDVLGSGTVGTGCLLEQASTRERWLKPGDVLELLIEKLGILTNTVGEGRK